MKAADFIIQMGLLTGQMRHRYDFGGFTLSYVSADYPDYRITGVVISNMRYGWRTSDNQIFKVRYRATLKATGRRISVVRKTFGDEAEWEQEPTDADLVHAKLIGLF